MHIHKIIFTCVLLVAKTSFTSAQIKKELTTLQVPAKEKFCDINTTNNTAILPSGRFVSPAGSVIRITNDPFGMAISPNGKKAVTLHNGVFTIINLTDLQATRVPSYNQTINSPLAHEPISQNNFGVDTIKNKIIKSPLPNGSFLGVAFAADSKTVYLSGGDNGAVIVYDIENFQRLDSISLNGKIDGNDFEDSFTSDLLLNKDELLILDRGNFRLVRYNLINKKITASIPAGRQPFGLAISKDKQTAFVANVGMYAYPMITGLDSSNFNTMLISHHPYGNNTKESIEGTEVEGKKIPGLGSPNAPEAMSVFKQQ
jgi:DNA-binding beta-propeller fold protein YncE